MATLAFFDNLKIIDLSTVLAGPSVSTFFAELGADVIKIEHPEIPDVTRSWKQPIERAEDTSAYFASVNYGKTYKKLNLSKCVDRSNLLAAIEKSDILIVNFKPGDQEKFRITDEELWKINRRLIIGKISGFGSEDDRVAYDLILQAETGFMSMNGSPAGDPTKMPVALIDILAAHHLKEGLLLALMERMHSNKGSAIEVSLYDAALCSLANQASNYLMTGCVPKRLGSLHPNIAPYGETFITNDSVQFTLAVGSNQQFISLLSILKLDHLVNDSQYSTNQSRVENRIELAEILTEKLKTFDSQHLFELMRNKKIPYGEIKTLDKVLADTKAKKLIREDQLTNVKGRRMTSIAFTWKK
ncbi:MAG: CoA transferase [Bacteroidetes bacterium]|nr:CoA transferase [Bacteroidota bacterium]